MQWLNSLLDVFVVPGCAALALATPRLAEASEGAKAVPIVFVHGFAGAATQYASSHRGPSQKECGSRSC